jgi:ATP-binding cassette subfamily F protein uup
MRTRRGPERGGPERHRDGDRRPPRHVISYLEDFLFPPERSRSQVKVLSGGERNRLLLARLFMRPSNLLVMDEPTNDLDAETLELLEDLLVEYPGTLLLVSHDREFLNNVVSSTMVFEGDGQVNEYAGGYDDWLSQRPKPAAAGARRGGAQARPAPARAQAERASIWKELEALPGRIEALEQELATLHQKLADPGFFKAGGDEVRRASERAEKIPPELETAYARWQELEQIRAAETG